MLRLLMSDLSMPQVFILSQSPPSKTAEFSETVCKPRENACQPKDPRLVSGYCHSSFLTMNKTSNQRFALDPMACLLMLIVCMNPAWSMEFTGHHGGVVTNCKDPEFYHETPAPNAKVKLLETFSFIASENTMTESLEVAVNLEPVKTQIHQNGNGTFTVEARITPPKTEGRAWIRVTGHSDDGCQQLHTWDIFVSPDGT
jgi:hypothetical protein